MKKAYLLPGLALFSAGVHLLNRRAKMSGATSAEATQTLPGDELITQPAYDATHAITIAAAPEQVWPWLLQMGYYRGGWYTENNFWWDRLTTRYLRFLVRGEARQSGYGHRERPSVTEINPEWQQLAVGDQILDGPPGTACFTVQELEPNQCLVLYSDTHLRYLFPSWVRDNGRVPIGGEFTWVFALERAGVDQTRFLLRTRSTVRPWWFRAFANLFFPITGAALELAMLRNIKERVEGARSAQPCRGSGEDGATLNKMGMATSKATMNPKAMGKKRAGSR